eukprot:7275007-Pyramimonas_sp.AAC.1
MAEDGRPSVEGEDLGDWESSALLVFRVNGHALLGAKVLDAVGKAKGRLQGFSFASSAVALAQGGTPRTDCKAPVDPRRVPRGAQRSVEENSSVEVPLV